MMATYSASEPCFAVAGVQPDAGLCCCKGESRKYLHPVAITRQLSEIGEFGLAVVGHTRGYITSGFCPLVPGFCTHSAGLLRR
jgi:hypothetical protein